LAKFDLLTRSQLSGSSIDHRQHVRDHVEGKNTLVTVRSAEPPEKQLPANLNAWQTHPFATT
jgi:hypothetical protein